MLISTIYGNKFLPILFRIVLVLLGIFFIYIAYRITFIAAIMVIYLFFITLLIRTKVLEIYEDRFVVEKISLLSKFNRSQSYPFSNIKRVLFKEGHFNLATFLFLFLGGSYGSQTPVNSPDTMEILKKSDEKIEIKRIGNKKDFIKTINLINERLKFLT